MFVRIECFTTAGFCQTNYVRSLTMLIPSAHRKWSTMCASTRLVPLHPQSRERVFRVDSRFSILNSALWAQNWLQQTWLRWHRTSWKTCMILTVMFNGVSVAFISKKLKTIHYNWTFYDYSFMKVIQYDPWRRRVQPMDRSQFSLTYKLDGEEVDILPAFDILGSE